MRIVFMGTPEFAAASLRRLYEDGREIAGVFTRPDKPVNRGMKLSQPPVKQVALEHGTPVFQPVGFQDGTALEDLRRLAPDLIVVVAYGRILPREVLELPPLGCINIHGSLLPKYRGAAPVQWAVLNGERVTGVTAMYLAEEMDAGDMIDTITTEIGEEETASQLFVRMMDLGAELLSRTVTAIEQGTARRTPQDPAGATYAPMLSRELSPIDWSKSPEQIRHWVLGLQDWPSATAVWGGKRFKILRVAPTGRRTDRPDGSIVEAGKNGLFVACGGGQVLEIVTLQAEGKKATGAADYLRGNRIQED